MRVGRRLLLIDAQLPSGSAAGGENGDPSPGSGGGGRDRRGDGGKDGMVVAALVPAAVASLVVRSTLVPVSFKICQR